MAAKAADLQAAQLPECHFKWLPEKEAIKKLKNVRQNALGKLDVDPLNRVAYYTLLAYVYCQPETVNFKEADTCLKSADEVCQQVQAGELSADHLTCQFVIDANRLCIQRQRKQNVSELARKFQELQTRWENMDDEARAAVFAVKGLALLRFGLNTYPDAAEAYAEANRLTRRKHFLFLLGEASVLGRVRRSKSLFDPASDDEVKLWQQARELSVNASADFDRSHFLVLNAEAMLNNGRLQFCKSLVDEAWNSVRDLPHSEGVRRYRILQKSAKCYRVIRSKYKLAGGQELEQRMIELDAEISGVHDCFVSMKDDIPNAGVLFHFSNELHTTGRLVDSRRLLEQAQRVADKPGHVYAECKLIFMKQVTKRELNEQYSVEDCLTEYDNLIAKFAAYSPDVATVMLNKAEFLIKCKRLADSLQTMIEADELDPLCWTRFLPKRLFSMYRLLASKILEIKPDHFAWFLQHVRDHIEIFAPDVNQFSAQLMYEVELDINSDNQFSLEHLGRLHLSDKRYSDAEVCFRRLLSLSQHFEHKKLLAASMLHSDTQQVLKECCSLGCKDACEKLLQLMLREKNDVKLQTGQSWLQLQIERYNSGSSTDSPQLPHCSRESYEVCALIHNLLESDSAFFIRQPDDEQLLHDRMISQIEQLLEINRCENGVSHRVNALRRSRFQASRLRERGEHNKEFNNEVCKTLKEAKESLDRSANLLPQNTFPDYYVHGFNYLKSRVSKSSDFNRESKSMSGDEAKKLAEHAMVDIMQNNKELTSRESISSALTSELKRHGCQGFARHDSTRKIFEFLVSRESAIFSAEGPWLIRWIYGANREKHSRLWDFDELNEQLASHGKGPRSAYEMAHRAAEFAEETRLLMMSWMAQDEADAGAVAADEGIADAEDAVDTEDVIGLGQMFDQLGC